LQLEAAFRPVSTLLTLVLLLLVGYCHVTHCAGAVMWLQRALWQKGSKVQQALTTLLLLLLLLLVAMQIRCCDLAGACAAAEGQQGAGALQCRWVRRVIICIAHLVIVCAFCLGINTKQSTFSS
jgi:hypothetical protein